MHDVLVAAMYATLMVASVIGLVFAASLLWDRYVDWFTTLNEKQRCWLGVTFVVLFVWGFAFGVFLLVPPR